jgi:hypothetical protein
MDERGILSQRKESKWLGKNRIVQEHHILYKERDGKDKTVFVWKGEHQILTLLNLYTRVRVSKGFIQALRFWLKNNGSRGIDIKPKYKKSKRRK